MIDTKAIEEHIRGIITALGDDPERPGLKDTPRRVAAMYTEVFEGMNYTNHEIARMFDRTFDDDIDTGKEKIVRNTVIRRYDAGHVRCYIISFYPKDRNIIPFPDILPDDLSHIRKCFERIRYENGCPSIERFNSVTGCA